MVSIAKMTAQKCGQQRGFAGTMSIVHLHSGSFVNILHKVELMHDKMLREQHKLLKELEGSE